MITDKHYSSNRFNVNDSNFGVIDRCGFICTILFSIRMDTIWEEAEHLISLTKDNNTVGFELNLLSKKTQNTKNTNHFKNRKLVLIIRIVYEQTL